MDINSIISKNIDGYLIPKYHIYRMYYIACFRPECDEMDTLKHSKIVQIIPVKDWTDDACFEKGKILEEEFNLFKQDGVIELDGEMQDRKIFWHYNLEELKYIIYKMERLA